eukprot:maker-scaffold_44-snap-gene-1.93-mRNA-1 protein AED:0.02 eAED:0.02 QI:14/1/1/1/1/1/2/37/235
MTKRNKINGDPDEKNSSKKQKLEYGKHREVIVILEEATLETVKTSKGKFELLNCDDHLYLHKKLNKKPENSRPDITHQILLTLLDSPLNKSGYLKIFVRTNNNICFTVSNKIRIPRTFKRFSGLITQLLHKLKIQPIEENSEPLMKIIKSPIHKHLPPNSIVFSTTMKGELVEIDTFVKELNDKKPYVFIFGAFAHGFLSPNYSHKDISLSEYPLSAAYAVSRLTNAFEKKWNIL